MTALSQTVKLTEFLNSSEMGAIVLLNRIVLATLNDVSPSSAHVVAQATNTTGVKTTGTATFTVDGVLVSKAATDPLWTLTGSVLPVASFTRYALLLNASGTASVLQGTVSQVSAASVVYQSMPDGAAVVGYVTIQTDATHTFTPGTTSLTAAGITAAFFTGTDKVFFPLLADSANGNEILQLSGLANSGSLLG